MQTIQAPMQKLSPQLRDTVSNDQKFDPFSEHFDSTMVMVKLKEEKGADALMDFLLLCHDLYWEARQYAISEIAGLKVTRATFLNTFFKEANSFFSTINKYSRTLLKDDNPSELSASSFYKIHKDGDDLDLLFLIEIGPDIVAEIIKWVKATDAGNIAFADTDELCDNNSLTIVTKRLWMKANIVLNARNAYEIIKYERGNAQFTKEGHIKVMPENSSLQLIKTCGAMRFESHLQEGLLYMQHLLQMTLGELQLSCTVSDGILTFHVTERTRMFIVHQALSSLLSYHSYIMILKLDHFGGLCLQELSEILYLFDEAVTELAHNEPDPSKDFRLLEDNIVDIIAHCAGTERSVAERIFQSLCSNDLSPNFWRGMFHKDGAVLNCPLVALASPNYTLYFEKWLVLSGVSIERQENRFNAHILDELGNINNRFEFNIIDFEDVELDKAFFEQNVLIQVKGAYVLLQTVLFNFPVETPELHEGLEKVMYSIVELENKKRLIEGRLMANDPMVNVIPILVTKYPHYSGLVINDVPVADFNLFTNYFASGKFRKSKLAFRNEQMKSVNTAEFNYYLNEEEFVGNIDAFFKEPVPIYEMLGKLFLKEISVTPAFLHPQIVIDKVEYRKEDEIVQDDIVHLTELLTADYFADPGSRKGMFMEENVRFRLSEIFMKVSHGRSTVLDLRTGIQYAIRASKERGFMHLSLYIINSVSKLNISMNEDDRYAFKEPDNETIASLLDMDIFDFEGDIIMSKAVMSEVLSGTQKDQLLAFAYVITSSLGLETYDPGIADSYVLALTVLCASRKEYKIDSVLYSSFSNYIDYLNYNHKTQDARDLCEEILAIYSTDRQHWKAWSILFRCYSNQKNHFDSAIYGSLLVTELVALPAIPYHITVATMQELIIFFRNFKYHDLAKRVYESSQEIGFKEYDSQKMAIAYFNSLVLMGQHIPKAEFDGIADYLSNTADNIVSFGENAIVPWLGLLYNFLRMKEAYGFSFDNKIFDHLAKFEANLRKEQVDHLQTMILGRKGNLKALFIRSISDIYRTRNVTDFIAEINNLTVVAQNLLKHSIEINDIDGILLSGQVLNDQTFTFHENPLEPGALKSLNAGNTAGTTERWNAYGTKMLDVLTLNKGQLLVWIFELYNQVYCLAVDESKNWQVLLFEQWDSRKAEKWIEQLKVFFFNSRRAYPYDIPEQERDYETVKEELEFSLMPITQSFSELLIVSSLNMAEFPPNLYIKEADFIGAQLPVCNVISLERYQEKGCAAITMDRYFTSSAWVPIDDQEGTINWGYTELKPVLDQLQSIVHTSRYPLSKISTDFNIFLAHGEVDEFGFRAVHTNKEEGGTIVYPSKVFGNGTVAVLFVCSTAKITDSLYSNNIVSFAAELLKRNYEAVIAPFWKLDVTISGIWLQEFIDVFRQGYSINQSVYLANKEISKYQESISNSFYAVEGQLAMHLYGNPNIRMI